MSRFYNYLKEQGFTFPGEDDNSPLDGRRTYREDRNGEPGNQR